MKKIITFLFLSLVSFTFVSAQTPVNPCSCGAWLDPDRWEGDSITMYVDFNYTFAQNIAGDPDLYVWLFVAKCPTGNCSETKTDLPTPAINNGTWNNSNEAHKMTYYDGKIYSFTIANPVEFFGATEKDLYGSYIGFLAKKKNGKENDVEYKTEDMFVKIKIPLPVGAKVDIFPKIFQKDDAITLIYNNALEPAEVSNMLKLDSLGITPYIHFTVDTAGVSPIELSSLSSVITDDRFKMTKSDVNMFKIEFVPEKLFSLYNIPATTKIYKISVKITQPGYTPAEEDKYVIKPTEFEPLNCN